MSGSVLVPTPLPALAQETWMTEAPAGGGRDRGQVGEGSEGQSES